MCILGILTRLRCCQIIGQREAKHQKPICNYNCNYPEKKYLKKLSLIKKNPQQVCLQCRCFIPNLVILLMFASRPLACNEEYFGTNCSRECSPNCKSGTCRQTDGWSICTADLTNDNCTTGMKVTIHNYSDSYPFKHGSRLGFFSYKFGYQQQYLFYIKHIFK